MREKLTILNAFVHDVATGTWIGSLILITMLHGEAGKPAWAPASGLVQPLAARFMLVTWVSLGVVLLTGVARMATFKVFGWTGEVARDRIRLLKVKHALLGLVFLAGTAWQIALVYF
jgi:putative copper export protein